MLVYYRKFACYGANKSSYKVMFVTRPSCYDVIITKKVSHGGQASCQVWLMHIPIIKSTVMQIKKALINHHLRVSKVLWKFPIPTIYNFPVIYPWNLLFSWNVDYFLTISIVFSVYRQNFTTQISKVLCKFPIPTIYTFPVIYPWNLLFS